MAKVTNTGNTPVSIGSVEVPAHQTVDVPDEELQKAKQNKMVESWFANGTLKMGESEDKPTQHPGGIHANVEQKSDTASGQYSGGETKKDVGAKDK